MNKSLKHLYKDIQIARFRMKAEESTFYANYFHNTDHPKEPEARKSYQEAKKNLPQFQRWVEANQHYKDARYENERRLKQSKEPIPHEDMLVIVSQDGFIKRIPLSNYRVQQRGGIGKVMESPPIGNIAKILVANNHTPLLFFSTFGLCFSLKTYQLPLSPSDAGDSLTNLLNLKKGEEISVVLPLTQEKLTKEALVFATSQGTLRRNSLGEFLKVRSGGKTAMKLKNGEVIVAVEVCSGEDDIMLTSKNGKCVLIAMKKLRVFKSRASLGVRGIKVDENDEVISLSSLQHINFSDQERSKYLKVKRISDFSEAESDYGFLTRKRFQELEDSEQLILTVTEQGLGKKTSAYAYRRSNRGVAGVATIRRGLIVGAWKVRNTDQLILATNRGKILRCHVSKIREAGRSTKGVTLMRFSEEEKIVSVAMIPE